MDFGEDPYVSDSQRRKKRYHRHTPRQIQELEATFKECPHPDEKQRMQLSRDLGLEPKQIKFWFQNRRTQMKTQHERADNCTLRAENDKIRYENIAMREALKNIICPNCGGPPVSDEYYFDEHKLRMENARLKEELDRASSISSKYLGRPMTQHTVPSVQPLHMMSSLDLTVGSFGSNAMGPSLDLDLLPGNHSSVNHQLPFPVPLPNAAVTSSMMADMAASAMAELIRLAQTEEPLWIKSALTNGSDILNLETYGRMFPRFVNQFNSPNVRSEASRGSEIVTINSATLVDLLVDTNKWIDLFPTIISKARTLEVLAPGIPGTRSGSLVLMYEEIQVLSPLVSTREFSFLRYCQQVEQGLWAITDVSVDLPREKQFAPAFSSKKLPSGCLIQEMSNGCSKVTWVVHMEVEEKSPTHGLYRELVDSGIAFGAQRWLATLKRMCERISCLMTAPDASTRELGGCGGAEGKRSMMNLSRRMVSNFCASLSPSITNEGPAGTSQRWTNLTGVNDVGVRVTVHKSTDPGQPNGVVLSAATSIWLPVSCNTIFNFFKDERTRCQWDVLSNGNPVQEIAHITNGSSHPGNRISLLRAFNSSQNNMLILQESCSDSSGSLVVYAPVELPAINIAMSGEDPSYIPLLPSGFSILPDWRSSSGAGGGGASTSSNTGSVAPGGGGGGPGGSLVTVAFQILVSSLPSAKINVESINTVNNLISTTVQQIKSALNCTTV